ncbi:hypothetical protein [Rhodococcoides fascians]|uniref:hypothetical protein n=1 Tax=Rhodococcoides fascians TaxID=1828 RepID=UPI00050D036D|nr:hypothetical protein [Rhodococcus fascians]
MTCRWLVAVIVVVVVGAVIWNITIPERPVAAIVSADTMRCEIPYPDAPPNVVDRNATVPEDFQPVAAVLCDSFLGDDVAADRTVGYGEERWEGDFSIVVELLDRRSEHETWFPDSCGEDYSLAVLPEFWLLDDHGRAVRPGFPLNSCGRAKPGALGAIRDLTSAGRVEHRVALSDDQIRRYFRCPTVYVPPTSGSGQPAESLTIGNTFCRFDSRQFAGATPISTAPSLQTLPPAPTCDLRASSVAVTLYSDGLSYDQQLTIELDGCRRVIPDGYAPRQASEEILSEFR